MQMVSGRRIGSPDARNRTVLLDAAERIMIEEGYAAVTSRRVAQAAGLKPQLVHYYFRTMDELLMEIFRRRAEEGLIEQERALASPQPLWALWEYSTDARSAAFTMEFVALSNHRKTLKAEIARYSVEFRIRQIAALTATLQGYGVDLEETPAEVIMMLMTSVSRILGLEQILGVASGHQGAVALVERLIERYEGPRLRGGLEVERG